MMSANDVKFTKFNSLIPKDYTDSIEFLNSVINTWQPLDMREADRDLDGVDPEETIQIIANSAAGNFVVIGRLSNNMTKNSSLTEEDEANAALISRAPALYVMLRAFVGLIKNGNEIQKDSVLVKAAAAILGEIQEGKVHYKAGLENNMQENNEQHILDFGGIE